MHELSYKPLVWLPGKRFAKTVDSRKLLACDNACTKPECRRGDVHIPIALDDALHGAR